MSTFWAYTVARLAVLAAVLGVLYVAGARGILLIVLAFFVSALLSYWLLAGMRERLASGIETRASRINERLAAANALEDEAADAAADSATDSATDSAESPAKSSEGPGTASS